MSPTFSTCSKAPSSRSSSTSSASGVSMDRNLLLLSTAYQLPLATFGDLLSAKLSNASPTYELSSDPISQNFDFEDLFDFEEQGFSRKMETSATPSTSNRRQPSNMSRVGVTHPRTSTVKSRRQAKHHQPPQDLTEVPEAQEVRRFSFSHYPPIPQTTSKSLDSSSRRRQHDVPTRTSPGAARLHEMLARGR